MAMGLASINPMVGANSSPQGLMIKTKEDNDLSNYNVVNYYKDKKMIGLDKSGKVSMKETWDIMDEEVQVYYILNDNYNEIYKKLQEEALLEYKQRPIHESDYIYKLFTGNRIYTEDQPDYEPLLEKVYLDKLSKQLSNSSAVDSLSTKVKKDSHMPLGEKPFSMVGDEEDGDVRFPLLAGATLKELDKNIMNLLEGRNEEDAEA